MTRLSSLIDKGLNTPYIIADNNYYIPTGSVILYGGASDPGLTSQGWSYASEYNGYYIQGTTVNSSIGVLSSGTPTTNGSTVALTVGTAGAHSGSSVSEVQNIMPTPGPPPYSGLYNPATAGAHTHTAYAVLDNTSNNLNPPTRGWILLKSTKNTLVFPPSTILISGSQPTGSTQLTATATYTYIKGNSSPVLLAATVRSMNASPATDPGVSPAPGYHSHRGSTTPFAGTPSVSPGAVPGVYILEPYTVTPTSTTPWPPVNSGMYHTHSLSGGDISCTSLSGKIVKLWQIAQYSIPESATVIMYSGSIANLPTYWKICDGNNGTINMNGYFLGYSNSAATAHDTTTTTTITTSTITMSTNTWFHTHTSGVYTATGGYTWPVAHAAENQPHVHPVSNTGVTASYTPPSVKLCFIQFFPEAVPSTAVNTPNYISVVPSVTSVDEGSSVIFTVNTWENTNGTTLYWTIETNSVDFSTTSGSLTITDNTGTFSLTPTMDQLTEGAQTFTVAIRTGSISGPIVLTSDPVTINDTSLTATYSISTTSTIVNEGTTVTYTVTTTSVPNGYTLYYSNSGTTTALDFTDGLNSGSVTVTNNTATITRTLLNDLSYNEGSETLIIQLRTGSTTGTVVATASTVTILDTSFVTYSVTPTSNNVNEDSSLTLNATTQNVANGTTLYWTIDHTTTSTADFSAESGSITISGNSGSFSISTVADLTTEGLETFTVSLRTGSITGTVVATSSTITVNDTSVYNGPQFVASFTSNNFTAQVASPFAYAKAISPTITLNPGELAIAFVGQIGNFTKTGNMTNLGSLVWTLRNGSSYETSATGATNGTNKSGLDIFYVYNNTASTITGTSQLIFQSNITNGFWVVNTYSNTNQTTPFTSNLPNYGGTVGYSTTWQSASGQIPSSSTGRGLKATTAAQLGIAAVINYSTNYSPPTTPSTWTEVTSYTGSNFIFKVWNLQSPPITGVNSGGVSRGSTVGNSNWTTSGTYPWGLYVDSLNHA